MVGYTFGWRPHLTIPIAALGITHNAPVTDHLIIHPTVAGLAPSRTSRGPASVPSTTTPSSHATTLAPPHRPSVTLEKLQFTDHTTSVKHN